MIDECQLCEHRVGANVEGPQDEHGTGVEEEEEVSSTTRILAFDSTPEGTQAEPEEGHDDAISSRGDECASKPCMFCGELFWRLRWAVGHVSRGARIARPFQ